MKPLPLWIERIMKKTGFISPLRSLELRYREDLVQKEQYINKWRELIQDIVSGKTANPLYPDFRETLLTTYSLHEESNFVGLLNDFIDLNAEAAYNLVMENVPGAPHYNVRTDYLHVQPEIILLFERSINNPSAMISAFHDTHFTEPVEDILNKVLTTWKPFHQTAL